MINHESCIGKEACLFQSRLHLRIVSVNIGNNIVAHNPLFFASVSWTVCRPGISSFILKQSHSSMVSNQARQGQSPAASSHSCNSKVNANCIVVLRKLQDISSSLVRLYRPSNSGRSLKNSLTKSFMAAPSLFVCRLMPSTNENTAVFFSSRNSPDKTYVFEVSILVSRMIP